MKPVTDPALLEQLEGASAPKPVTDPALLRELEGTAAPAEAGPTQGLIERGMRAMWDNPVSQFTLNPVLQAAMKASSGVLGLVSHGVGRAMENFSPESAYKAGGYVTDKTGSPLAGYLTNVGLQSAPLLIGGIGKRTMTPAASLRQSQNAVRDQTLAEARRAGMVVPPSAAGGGVGSKILESIGGKASTGQQASLRNQAVIDALARSEAGLSKGTALTESNLASSAHRLSEPYREVASLSKKAASALEKLQEARLDVKDLWAQFGRMPSPAIRKEAMAAQNKVAMLERVIEKEASLMGRPELATQLKQARVALAKVHDVDKAINIGSGHVDASVLGRTLAKSGEKAVTGDLQTIGKFQQAFPTFARAKESGKAAPGVSALRATLALAGGGAAYGSDDPRYLYAALPLFLSGPARALALSKLAQTAPVYGSRVPNLVAPILASQIQD